jgi:hypothetical protein
VGKKEEEDWINQEYNWKTEYSKQNNSFSIQRKRKETSND